MAVNYCLTIVFNPKHDRVLMQLHKDRGWNFPGGHIEENEPAITAAYRELEEETGIKNDILSLSEVNMLSCIDIKRHQDMTIHVYQGTLKKKVTLRPEGDDILVWMPLKGDFWLHTGRDHDGLAWTLLQWALAKNDKV